MEKVEEIIKKELNGQRYKIVFFYNTSLSMTEEIQIIDKETNKNITLKFKIKGEEGVIAKISDGKLEEIELWKLDDGFPLFTYLNEFIEELKKPSAFFILPISIDIEKCPYLIDKIAEYFLE